MKKIFSALLSVIMLLAMSTTVFAASGTNNSEGKITIKDPVVGETYSVYQMFVLESYNTDPDGDAETNDGVYAYTITDTSAWYDFVKEGGAGASYISLETFKTENDVTTYYVTWSSEKSKESDYADFAKLALKYAQDNNIKATKTSEKVTEGTESVVFDNLNLGYYLVDSSLGALVMLNTTNPTAEINEKNTPPTVDKKVQEDSDSSWGASNTAQIGDTVSFQTTISAKAGAQNYVLHDTMSEGLTFGSISSVKVGETTLTAGTQYTVKTKDSTEDATKTTDGCTFEIVFSQDYLDTITEDTNIIVTYTAILNDKAVVSTNANTNDTQLDYGDGSTTTKAKTETYTLKFDIVKTDSSNKLLDGAKFELYDAETGGNKINLVKQSDGTYRVATTAESTAQGFTSAVIEATDGKATVIGLDANTTYWLEETEAPNGYNMLASRTEVSIVDENLTTTMDATATEWTDGDGGVHITNKTGAELPETGGMGTTIFYIVGGVLVVGAAVLLIVRLRMRTEKGNH